MALPAQRTNRVTNPSPAVGTGWSVSMGAAGTGTTTYGAVTGLPSKRGATITWTASPTAGWNVNVARYPGVAAGKSFTAALTGKHSWAGGQAGITIQFFDAANASLGYYSAARQTIAANTVTTLSHTATAPAGATQFAVFWDAQGGTLPPVNGVATIGAAFGEEATAYSVYWDGETTEANYTHAWTGTANASTSTRDVYGVWPEQSAESGAPKVQVTAIGLGSTSVTTQIIRESGGESWTVPGWKKRNTLGGATFTDFAPPLGRPVTYTLLVNGSAVSSRTITVASTQGWVSSPIQPELAMPIALDGSNPNQLSLAKPSLKDYKYSSRGDEEYPMGGRYPVARSAPRGGAEGVQFVMYARTDAVSDEFQRLMAASPILLFRGLPTWGSLPPLSYIKGDVVENPFNRDVGQGFTQWTAEGRLVAPVATAPVSGSVTNQMVADNLTGRTHASIAAASGNKRNIDIAANPLGLGS